MSTEVNNTDIQLSNNDTQLSTINIAPELLQRIDDTIDKLTKRFNEAAKLTCFCGRHLTVDEYDKAIDDTTQALLNGHEQSELLEKELYYFKRDRQKLVDFNNTITAKRLELFHAYSHPIEYGVNYVIRCINQYLATCLDNIYESFINKVKLLCPENDKYEQAINNIYVTGSSKKVVNLLNDYTNMIIDGFTKLLYANYSSTCSTNITEFDNFTKFYKKIKDICFNIYNKIYYDINDKIEQFPSYRMSSVKLVITYAEALLSNIHEFIVHDVSKSVNDSIVRGIDKLQQLGFIHNQTVDSIKAQNDVVDNNRTVPIVEVVDDSIKAQNDVVVVNEVDNNQTFDSFIESLNREESYTVNTLQELYNHYFNTNISTRKLSKLLTNCDKLTKSRKLVNGRKITVYTMK